MLNIDHWLILSDIYLILTIPQNILASNNETPLKIFLQ